uniref:secoisolariciresinol dehydrogenase-like n=1 Tax=Fragaria vesca subsp. vesca TaxID=101020 RepID=UPI0005C7E9E1|nr:PREDICTED: secoisolariciresinol dehydrogenase-like [Fragaria vesca subsp. vesca]
MGIGRSDGQGLKDDGRRERPARATAKGQSTMGKGFGALGVAKLMFFLGFNFTWAPAPPLMVATPLTKDFFKLEDGSIREVYSNLKGAVLTAEDVAEAVLYLGSDESKYVSGHNLVVDGGYTIVNPSRVFNERS